MATEVDSRAIYTAWQPRVRRHPLFRQAAEDQHTQLSGVLPLWRDGATGEYWFYLAKPHAKHPHLPPPLFQFGKGTRMQQVAGQWQDVPRQAGAPPLDLAQAETLLVTALREGVEEIGLRLENIAEIMDAGIVLIASSNDGRPKPMGLFLAMVKQRDAFDAPDPRHATTASCRWMRLGEEVDIRPDHCAIIKTLLAQL